MGIWSYGQIFRRPSSLVSAGLFSFLTGRLSCGSGHAMYRGSAGLRSVSLIPKSIRWSGASRDSERFSTRSMTKQSEATGEKVCDSTRLSSRLLFAPVHTPIISRRRFRMDGSHVGRPHGTAVARAG